MAPILTEKIGTEQETAEATSARDEQCWDAQFAGSLDVLEDLYDEITADDKAGRTTPINV